MKALKVYENKLFKSKTPEEIKRDLPYDDFKEMVNIGNERIFHNLGEDIDFPVISDIWVQIYKNNYLDPEGRTLPFKVVSISYSEAHGRYKRPYWEIKFKYKNKNFIFIQEEGNDYMTPISSAAYPLYLFKIYNFEDLLKYLEKNYKSGSY